MVSLDESEQLVKPSPPSNGQFGGSSSSTLAGVVDLCEEMQVNAQQGRRMPNFIHIHDDRLSAKRSVTNLSRVDARAHSALSNLASIGYFQYLSESHEARFVHRGRIATLWEPVVDGRIRVSESGIYHSVEMTCSREKVNRLVIIFSGVAANPSSASLMRYFEPNYRHFSSLTSGDTAILRIADVGGVVGAFYMNTREFPDNAKRISDLIRNYIEYFNVPSQCVCLVGSSKGATGALMHGLETELPIVAVDPILSDSYYESEMGDAHFTKGSIFEESKQSLFKRLATLDLVKRDSLTAFFTSPHSEQFSLVSEYLENIRGPKTLCVSFDSRIDGHPAVAGKVLGLTLTVVNAVVHQMPLPSGVLNSG